MSGVFNTVKEIVDSSNNQYSFINLCAENIQNNDEFKQALLEAVGEKNTDFIMGGYWTTDNTRLRTSFGDTLSINDFVSDNYMLNNASGDVQLIITDKARLDTAFQL